MPDLAVSIRGLVRTYGQRRALDGLDLDVPRGVVCAFLGPNGAGKTTMMRILTGLIHADAGTVELFGRPFRWGQREPLFDVGALIESRSFYPYLSGADNLRVLAATGRPPGRGRVAEALEVVGLTGRARDQVSTYSLGMKQRLGIAAALLNDPPLLLLDEPANGLDPAGIVEIRELFTGLAAKGKTVLVSSHVLPEVQAMADYAAIITSWNRSRYDLAGCPLPLWGPEPDRGEQSEWVTHRAQLPGLSRVRSAPPRFSDSAASR